VQLALLGPPGEFGTGAIPFKRIERISPRRGVTDAVDMIVVSGRRSHSRSWLGQTDAAGRREYPLD
jgi:hypothetical protein